MKARPMLVQKNMVTHTAVSLVTKLPEPCAPNTLPEEFPPNAAPASAPFHAELKQALSLPS